MKASQLISELQALVNEYGDREIEVNGEWNNDYPLNTCSRLKVNRIDWFEDSDNYQLMVDNFCGLLMNNVRYDENTKTLH